MAAIILSMKAVFITIMLAAKLKLCLGVPKNVTIDAAYTDNDYVVLISGDSIMFVDRSFKFELFALPLKDITPPKSLQELDTTAAFSTLDSFQTLNVNVFYYGTGHGLNVTYAPHEITADPITYDPQGHFMTNGGPDAAAKKGERVYFFKGDHMALLYDNGAFGVPVALALADLPCNVDAAWNDGKTMILLKGDQIWRWHSDKSATGPESFHKVYSIRSWKLTPSTAPGCT